MTTWTAFTTLRDQTVAEALATALEALTPEPYGVGAFEIEDGSQTWEVGAYFTDPPDAAGLALLAKMHGARDFAVSELPETDWVAHVRRELSPVRAGRFFVHGGHDAHRVPEGAVGLRIEAAMAFGTGHHGTTKGCLLALENLAHNRVVPRKVADIGCGTAVLAMAAANIWDVPVFAGDIDEIAVEVAQKNVEVNGLTGRIATRVSEGFADPEISDAAPYDLVFANILKGPLMEMAPEMARHIAPGGFAILSGILNEQAAEVSRVYAQNGFNVHETMQIVDWTTLSLCRDHH